MDHHGVAKLDDFSLCIALPPGESKVEDIVIGTVGCLDPEYIRTGIVTEKCDVYSFGVVLLELVTGQRPIDQNRQLKSLQEYVKDHVDKKEMKRILDPLILGERGETEQEHQLQAFAELALRCVGEKGSDRPDIVDVAKELKQIQRSVHPC